MRRSGWGTRIPYCSLHIPILDRHPILRYPRLRASTRTRLVVRVVAVQKFMKAPVALLAIDVHVVRGHLNFAVGCEECGEEEVMM